MKQNKGEPNHVSIVGKEIETPRYLGHEGNPSTWAIVFVLTGFSRGPLSATPGRSKVRGQ
ncbi:hypothetical protein BDA96_02G444700 [Sorghum bicolor]|uniref:Uncharacterized protein n=2 Tax=Sorghum bicolor TaxID=4558 RepID=A0A921RUJ8_SORBI|nr:hypothetical protein BDA96_02G444700 [Sorghum bicolor]OQU90521.1 hypothetical protein SORBI_3002G424550 [Sorghum bicolor]